MVEEVAVVAASSPDFRVLPHALSSDRLDGRVHAVGGMELLCSGPRSRDEIPNGADWMAVDFSTPDSGLDNIRWLSARGIPFVSGTTGFDRNEAAKIVADSSVSAVIAPNMAFPIVMIQSALNWLGKEYPGALEGWRLAVTESHQAGKRDTSGTAKAMAGHFQELGIGFSEADIRKIRDPDVQRNDPGIPEEHLGGHAWHGYELSEPGGTVDIGLRHAVLGRKIYAEGTLRALRFLKRRIDQGERGAVYSLEDVLRERA